MSGPGLVQLVKPQFGIESGYGVLAAATRMFLNIETFTVEPVQVTEESGTQGLKYDTLSNVYRESTKISAKCTFDYINSGWGFTTVEGVPASGAYSPGGVPVSGVYQHVWESSAYNEDTFQSYTVEGPGSLNDRVQRIQGVMFAGYKIGTESAKKFSLDFTGFGNKLHDTVNDDGATAITASTGQNAVLTATVGGTPTSMNIVLVYDNQQSDVLAYTNATTASAVQTAIRSLGGIWVSATVSGSAGGPYTITNVEGIAIQPLLYILSAQVGGPGTLAIVQTTPGGMKTEPVFEVMPTDIAISSATTLGGLDTSPTVPVDQYKTDLEVSERTQQVWRQGSGVEAAYVKEKKEQKHTQSMMLAYDSQVAALIQATRAVGNAGMYFRIAFTGLEIGTTGVNRQLIFDFFCKPMWKTANTAAEGDIRSCEFDLKNLFDTAGIFVRRITAINENASYVTP